MNSIETIYEWLESKEFDELSHEQKQSVLAEMSEEEYSTMRKSIVNTQSYFEKMSATGNQTQKGTSIFTRRIKMYKVAIAACLIIALQIILHVAKPEETNTLFAQTDTVYVNTTDTVWLHEYDTIEKIKERIVYKEAPKKERTFTHHSELDNTAIDCKKTICPKDLNRFKTIENSNSLKEDKRLQELFVMME